MKDEDAQVLLKAIANATPGELVEMIERATALIYFISSLDPNIEEGELSAVSAAREFVTGIEKQLNKIHEKLTTGLLFQLMERAPVIPKDAPVKKANIKTNIMYN